MPLFLSPLLYGLVQFDYRMPIVPTVKQSSRERYKYIVMQHGPGDEYLDYR